MENKKSDTGGESSRPMGGTIPLAALECPCCLQPLTREVWQVSFSTLWYLFIFFLILNLLFFFNLKTVMWFHTVWKGARSM
ncbi:hypothetical protein Dimus_038202 [Dionaea muscipula]